ncbi:MAG: hypothetical protein ACRBFS_01385 [Aureispira sp.]
MKYLIVIFSIILISCETNNKKSENETVKNLNKEIEWLYEWISAWELIVNDEFKLGQANPPEMLFFDTQYVYTNSKLSAPNGKKIKGPNLYGKKIEWLKQEHNDTLIIPDGNKVPIQIMTFASPSEKEGIESFFVMAAPSFWKNAGIDSEEVGLENMLTGVFLHEFAHTRQMDGIGKKITDYDNNYQFDFSVSDDLIQDYFSNDSIYTKLFREQTELIYEYLNTEKPQKGHINDFIQNFAVRQEEYLKPKKNILVEMDKVFLTMEGIGQYAMIAWLTHPNGGGFSEKLAIKATRRGKSWWSQDEGLAWVLLYKKIAKEPNWTPLFSENPPNIFELIENEINTEQTRVDGSAQD